MLCSSCYYENEKDALFCNRCGGKLETQEEKGEGSLMEDDIFSEYVRDKLSDKYRITRVLGRGGMAIVFEALELQLNRKVALKVLPMEHAHSKDLVRRFKQEAQLAAGLHHPHIIPIYSVGSVERIHYFTMAYLEGDALEERIQKGMYLRDAIFIVKQVADALNYAHGKKLIHRDIKPANIMFDEHGSAYVVDFGIAKAVVNTMVTATQSFFGTPHYMSPEQVVDERIDGRSDIYSLGVIFYQMVTGRFPFDGTEALSVMYKHVNENATPPNMIHNIPDKVSDIIMKLLAKDREKRYQTGEALMRDLEALPESISGPVKPVRATSNGKEHAPNPELAQTLKVQSVAVELAPPRKRGPVADASFSRGMGTMFQRLKKDRRSVTGLMGGFVLVLLAMVVFLLLKTPKPVEPESLPEIVADQFARGEMFHEEDQAPQPNAPLTSPEEAPIASPDPDSEPEDLEQPVLSTPPKKKEKKRPAAKPKKVNARLVLKKEIQGLLRQMGVVVLPAGSFEMGSKSKMNRTERPIHEVKLNQFSLGKTEVSQQLWMAVMGTTPSCASGSNQPVTNITWDECQVFLKKLNRITGGKWRLPTEAEWEYACQLGGDGALDDQVWYGKNSEGAPHDVGTKSPDASGLRHMRGNVWEWVSDYYGKRYYKDSPPENPKGPDAGEARVIRGGSWNDKASYCRCEKRESLFPVLKNCEVGFRLAR